MLGVGMLALVVFPGWRLTLFARLRQWGRRGLQQGHRWGRRLQSGQSVLAMGMVQQAQGARAWWRRRWTWALFAAVGLLMPMALVVGWSLHSTRSLDGFDERVDQGNNQVSHLLRGEQLVPPPPLPPAVFMTAEVEVVRPMLASADRRWDRMDAVFVQQVLAIFKVMEDEHGYDMALLEGYRSPERQAMLAAKGSNVTMAGAWQSYHQYGLAADCAFYRGGKLVISEKDPWAMRGYQLFGQVAEQMGLTWGGRWQMMDLGHIEWRKRGGRAPLQP